MYVQTPKSPIRSDIWRAVCNKYVSRLLYIELYISILSLDKLYPSNLLTRVHNLAVLHQVIYLHGFFG